MKMERFRQSTLVLALVCTLFAGCQQASAQDASSPDSDVIQLNGSGIESGSSAVTIDGSNATITAPGTYRITGTLDDGQVVVDIPSGKATLILDGAVIRCQTGPALEIREAGEVTLELAEATENELTDGASYVSPDADAALFSKADLVIRGTGALQVNANYNDGIASRDTLRIESGSIQVMAKNHGIKGKDYLMIQGGEIQVTAEGDGIKATNDTQAAMGYVEVSGGRIAIQSADDGISAIGKVSVTGGEISIRTDNNGIKSDQEIEILAGNIAIETGDDGLVAPVQSGSDEANISVNGQAITL